MKKPQSRNDLFVMQGLVIHSSGAVWLISDICEGRVVELDPDRVKPIANWARAKESFCKKEFDLHVKAMTDMAIVNFFLSWAISALATKILLVGQTAEDERHIKKLKAIVAQ